MTPDFRSARMDTPEGEGRARAAFKDVSVSYNKAIKRVFGSSIASVASAQIEGMLGFWMMWHIYGGFEGLQELGIHQSTIWRKVAKFRKTFGKHPDIYSFPGITVDPAAYWAAFADSPTADEQAPTDS